MRTALRELAAVARALEAVSRVKWFTDNQNVVRIIKVGSRVDELGQCCCITLHWNQSGFQGKITITAFFGPYSVQMESFTALVQSAVILPDRGD